MSIATSTTSALAVTGLTKRYGSRTAVDHLDFELPRGVVAGFVGPNGSGKTTTMGMLLGLVRPSAGTGTVLGEPITDPGAYLHRVGALIETPAFYPALTGRENLRVFAIAGRHDPARIDDLLDLVGLTGRGDDRARTYSLGMKQRLGIAAALLGDPELLILDEPTNGLDPQGVREMRALVGRLAGDGRTVLVSSHDLSELEQVCDWLLLIDTGTVLYQGPTRDLLDAGHAELAVAPQHPSDERALIDALRAAGFTTERRDDTLVVTRRHDRRRRRVGRGRQPLRVRRRHHPRGAAPDAHVARRPIPRHDRRRCAMTAIIHAELVRSGRRRTLLIAAAVVAVFAVVATVAIFSSAGDTLGADSNGQGATLADLAAPGGGTVAFATGTSFAGFLVFVTFIGLMAREFSDGTFRALVMREPNRRRVIVGKVVGLLLVAAGLVAFTEVASFVLSILLAGSRDIDPGVWFSLDGLGHALGDYGAVMLGVAGWAVLGTTLAVIFRSVPIALAVGFAWAGPFENIVSRSWDTGNRVFPGRVLAALINGGTTEISFGRAVVTALIYSAIAATVALVLVTRRDVTA